MKDFSVLLQPNCRVLTIKTASSTDLMRIAACHQKAFPKALSSGMGKRYLCKMLEWYLVDERAFLFYIEQHGACVGYCGGLKVEAFGVGSASSMIQHSFSEAVRTFIIRPWLFFHPEFIQKYKLAARNIIRRFKRLLVQERVQQKCSQGKSPSVSHAGLIVIGVDPAFQGKGYGSRLLQEFEVISLKLGFRRLSLTVKTNNLSAIRSYSRNGWVTTEVKGNSTTMEKELST